MRSRDGEHNSRPVREPLTRRRFLGMAAAVAAPYVVPSSALGRGTAVAPSERVVVGYIGTGLQGLRVNLPMLLGLPQARVVAICDVWKPNRDRAKARVDAHYGNEDCRDYVDFRGLLAREDIDAVGIATPDHWHVPMTIAAVRAGKDVHVEKPLGISLAEGLACRDAVKRFGRVLQYGTESRSVTSCRRACELVRRGRIGEIREIHVDVPDLPKRNRPRPPQPVPPGLDYDLFLGPAPWRPCTVVPMAGAYPYPWYYVRDYCVGWITNWAAHLLDLLQWGFDTHLAGPWEVEGTGVIPTGSDHDVVVQWDVRIRFGNGVRMTFRGGGQVTRFVGTEGEIALRYGGLADDKTKALVQSSRSSGGRSLPVSTNHEQDFIECVKSRRIPVSSIDDAVRSDTIGHVSEIAVRTGRKITWDPVREAIVGDPEASRLLSRVLREPWHV